MIHYQYFWKTILPATVLAFAFMACQQRPKETKIVTISVLDTSAIYNADLVKDFIFAAEEGDIEQQKDAAKKDFLKGIDLKVNQKKNSEAVEYFRKSICTFPDAKSYYELSEVFMELGQYKEAENSLMMAEALRFQPLANLYFRQAKIAALQQYDEYSVVSYLARSVEQGFADKTAIENEVAFAAMQKTDAFQRFYLNRFTQVQDKETAEFRMFLAGFPVEENGFEIKATDIEKMSDKYISYDFAKYVKEMETMRDFGRDVGSEYFYAAKVQETEQYIAVVYIAKDAVAEFIPPIYASLVTYNHKGQQISKIAFACQCDAKTIKTGKIKANHITVTQHNREWEADFTAVSPENNKIKSVTEISQTSYLIAANGKIEPTSQATSLKLGNQRLLAVK
jgi:tetratricopeptide (TPR) repeat protein